MPDNIHVDQAYFFKDTWSNLSGWGLIGTTTTSAHIIYKYRATIENIWDYDYFDLDYDKIKDPETGEISYEFSSLTHAIATYSETNYYKDVVKSASEIANDNKKIIKNKLGNPPKNTDPPANVKEGIVTLEHFQKWEPDQVIVKNTGKQTTGTQSQITGVVQSVINDKLNENLKVDGWFGNNTENAVKEFQNEHGLTANGKLDANTFSQLLSLYGHYKNPNKPDKKVGSNPGKNNIVGGHDPGDPKYKRENIKIDQQKNRKR
jgi:hypothetical protein